MTVAVITLGLALLSAIGGIVYLVKTNRDDRKRADNAQDLYNAQLDVKHELEQDRADLTRKLSATDEQLREAKAKVVRLEISLRKAQEREENRTAERISRAPNPLDELTAVMREHTEVPEAASADGAGSDEADTLLNTTLR